MMEDGNMNDAAIIDIIILLLFISFILFIIIKSYERSKKEKIVLKYSKNINMMFSINSRYYFYPIYNHLYNLIFH